ncbi:glucose-1-phosphate adenylyltransferase [Planctomyces sp. SH-PL14]|uniref:glucose-1-phosphate adenylyltransferase n=1 Tax=Planctomyces sp. SH-PL14 TaxID=1632864 RepID=UPI00078D2915|nr:glucose-1-phosphate adenylyltransferase [Planctomyces sp. SH-PL14]AMV17944.1 Glucose-1-phosphate adenylyltransferase [Planctomyces sp. SH-PL14]
MRDVLTLVLAGGKGTRLEPLTIERSKPAVPFGGVYRIIDFTLSNAVNSGLRRILVLTQYKAASLDRHLQRTWKFLCREFGEFIDVLPPEQRLGEQWYQGTADAVYQNIFNLERVPAEHILILSGDHIYKMDYSEMIAAHVESGADATIGCLPVSLPEGRSFGIMGIDDQHWVRRFAEKPAEPFPIPGDPDRCLASMGIYVFNARYLFDRLCSDGARRDSSHDFGKDIIPSIIQNDKVLAFPFHDKNTGRTQYWRDVGTLDAYFAANMDLVAVHPELNLYDQNWPVRAYAPPLPPPKFVFADQTSVPPRCGHAIDSMVSPGCIISGGRVNHSVLGFNVRVNSYADVDESILFEGVSVGRSSRLRRVIIDKGVQIPERTEIGFDRDADLARGYTVTDWGVTVVPQSHAGVSNSVAFGDPDT